MTDQIYLHIIQLSNETFVVLSSHNKYFISEAVNGQCLSPPPHPPPSIQPRLSYRFQYITPVTHVTTDDICPQAQSRQ